MKNLYDASLKFTTEHPTSQNFTPSHYIPHHFKNPLSPHHTTPSQKPPLTTPIHTTPHQLSLPFTTHLKRPFFTGRGSIKDLHHIDAWAIGSTTTHTDSHHVLGVLLQHHTSRCHTNPSAFKYNLYNLNNHNLYIRPNNKNSK